MVSMTTRRGFIVFVLTLKQGDYVCIGDDIQVFFEHKISKNTVDIAIEAPREIPVLRERLLNKARQERQVE